MAKGEKRVSLGDFIQAWETSDSIAEVADKTGLKETSIQARASKYRSAEFNDAGDVIRPAIPLKTMPRGGGARLNVDEATALIAQLRGVSVEEIQQESVALAQKKVERIERREAAEAAE